MTSERDIERLLDRWFTERPTQVADRVIDDVAARIVRQPQRAAWRLRPWRFPSMSTPIKLVAVGAALLVVILGGAVFIGGGSGPVQPAPTATPSPSPVASVSPTTAPSAGAVFPTWWPSDVPPKELESCLQAATRPSPSGPASHSVSRRAGSTTLIPWSSTGCCRTRPRTRPSSLSPRAPPKASSWGSLTPRPSSLAKTSRRLTAPRPPSWSTP